MGRFSQEILESWTRPISESEDAKINNAISMVKSALQKDANFNNLNYEVFVQGSYGNNTNIRINSDIDVNVMLKSSFFSKYPKELGDRDYGFVEGSIDYQTYKNLVLEALKNKFGSNYVTIGNKSLKIEANTYRVEMDCIPTMQFRNYEYLESRKVDIFKEGVKYIANDGRVVINYPKVHIENGKAKNINVNRRYKRTVRLFKRIRNKMREENMNNYENITSFLLECLIWNIPDTRFTNYILWDDTLKNTLAYLKGAFESSEYIKMTEVSKMFYLFNDSRKWTAREVKEFLDDMWLFMGY